MIFNILRKTRDIISNLKIKYKLFIFYVLLLLLPFTFFTFITVGKVSNTIKDKVMYSAEQAFDQSASFLKYKIYKINSSRELILGDSKFTDIIQKASEADIPNQLDDMDYLRKRVYNFQDGLDILLVRLYVSDGLFYSNENYNIFNIKQAESTEWLKLYHARKQRFMWIPSQYLQTETSTGAPVLSYLTPVLGTRSFTDYTGLIRLDIKKRDIEDILSKSSTIKNSFSLIMNSYNEIIAASSYDKLSTYDIDSEPSYINSQDGNKWHTVSLNGIKTIIRAISIPNSDWKMISVIPESDVTYESNLLKKQISIIMLIILTLAYILVYFLSTSFSKITSKLVKTMKEAKSGKINKINLRHGTDEIGEVIESYNVMVDKISLMMAEQNKIGQDLKTSELKALQSQINPHFLYNTLDMINWFATFEKLPEIKETVQALSKFYRITLSKGNHIVTIADELKHISYYVRLQNLRFENTIEFNINVDEEILDYEIPKITFQPLVENAILHGLYEKESKKGTISISSLLQVDRIIISIRDDGIGIPEDRLAKINLGIGVGGNENGSGYGVKNINDRLKMLYGEKFGLIYISQPGKGTIVEIHLPAIK